MGTQDHIDTGLKLFLILFGLADFFGLLAPSLDILDKVLTSLILLYFWFKLKPSRFLFGKSSKKLDVFILISYYILVLNTFLKFVEPIVKASTYAGISQGVNLFSIYGGTISLLLLSIYVSFFIDIGEKSVAHSIISIFDKKGKFFEKIKGQSMGWHSPIEFLLNFVVLYSIGIYFFGLINQWFVVSLDKSLLLVAVLFAVKDLEHSKVKALHTLGEFDDVILDTVTDLFTNPKKFYLAFGFLLIFHYLSDIGTFFISYITHFIGLDTQYYALGQGLHNSLYSHFASEGLVGIWQVFSGALTYVLSGIGAVMLLLIPITFMFFIIFKVDIRELTYNKWFRRLLVIIFTSIVVFFIAPWTTQIQIHNYDAGVIGVDFITHRISEVSLFGFETIAIVSLIVVLASLVFLRFNKEFTGLIYLGSMYYLSHYVWNYFSSISGYYMSLISMFLEGKSYFLVFNFYILLGLDFLFYIGGSIILAYFTFRHLVKHVMKDIISDKLILIWTLVLILAPQAIMLQANVSISEIINASLLITTFFIFSYAMYKELTGGEYRDDYILGVNMAIVMYQILLLLLIYLTVEFGISEGVLNFLQPFIILLFTIIAIMFFGMHTKWSFNLKKVLLAILWGLLFGGLFFFIGEQAPVLFAYKIGTLVLFTLGVAFAEELLFRNLIFGLAKKAFTKGAIVVQGIVFALVHIAGNFHEMSWLVLLGYLMLLFLFSIVAGKLVEKNDVSYAIIMHFIANLSMIIISII